MSKKDSNVLKGIAIIMMLMLHLFSSSAALSLVSFSDSFEREFIYTVSVFCKVCVPIFVFITAYGLSKRYKHTYIHPEYEEKNAEGESLCRDCLRRYKKLILNYWWIYFIFIIVSCVMNVHTIGEVFLDGNGIVLGLKYFVIDLLGFARLFETPTFNATWWYMSLASLLFIIIPIVNMVFDKIGSLIIPLSVLISIFIEIHENAIIDYIAWYLLGISIAVCLARNEGLEKYRALLSRHWYSPIIMVLLLCLAFCGTFYLRSNRLFAYYFIDNIIALIIVMIVVTVSDIKAFYPVNLTLEFLGVHSMNIFMSHTFIKTYFFMDFTYSFKKWYWILLVLIVNSLIISVIVEFTKKGLCFIKKKTTSHSTSIS